MKALILCGGKGTRLRPITHTSAKQLIPIANKPIAFYAIEAMKAAGITDIGVIVGDTKTEVMSVIGEGERWGVSITYIPQDKPGGLAHAVKTAKDFLGNDSFVMFLGDNILKDGVKAFAKDFDNSGASAKILLAKVPNPRAFGVATVDPKTGSVVKLVEKPRDPESDLALVGAYLFTSDIFTAINNIKPSARGELEITDAIQFLIDNKYRVDSCIIKGWWKDTGNVESLLSANMMVLDSMTSKIAESSFLSIDTTVTGKVSIGNKTRITNSIIRGPVIIGDNCCIDNTFIGPYTAIADDVIIESSEIENSVILEDVQIIAIETRIADSLIGKGSKVYATEYRPKVNRIIVGDNSEVSII